MIAAVCEAVLGRTPSPDGLPTWRATAAGERAAGHASVDARSEWFYITPMPDSSSDFVHNLVLLIGRALSPRFAVPPQQHQPVPPSRRRALATARQRMSNPRAGQHVEYRQGRG